MSTNTTTLNPESFDAHLEHSLEEVGEVKSSLRASGNHAAHAAEELKAAAEAKAREWTSAVDAKTTELKEKAGIAYEDAKIRLKTVQKDAEVYVRENPLRAVAIAAGAGFLLGILARR